MTWLPVDFAATIILDLASAEKAADRCSNSDLVYHVLNPTKFHWTQDMIPALSAAGLEFEILPTEDWMELLRNSDRDPKKNPPIKLLDWFESKYGHGASEANKGTLDYFTEETKADSKAMNTLPNVVDEVFVRMMIERLRKHWNINT